MGIPTQCPNCGAVTVSISDVAPENHSEGAEWLTRAECENCEEYAEWFA